MDGDGGSYGGTTKPWVHSGRLPRSGFVLLTRFVILAVNHTLKSILSIVAFTSKDLGSAAKCEASRDGGLRNCND